MRNFNIHILIAGIVGVTIICTFGVIYRRSICITAEEPGKSQPNHLKRRRNQVLLIQFFCTILTHSSIPSYRYRPQFR